MKLSSPQHESEKVDKGNNDLKVNVNEQQDDIKQLKENCDIDDIEPPWNEMALCVTCNQTFATEMGWKKHIQEKHTMLL